MGILKKVFIAFLVVISLGFSSARAMAEDTMQAVLKDSFYGGLIGALLGSAVLLLTDKPEDHLAYIPTGAAVGILLGAAYGVASEGVLVTGAAEYDGGKLSFNMPTVKRTKEFDRRVNSTEVIDSIDLVKVRF